MKQVLPLAAFSCLETRKVLIRVVIVPAQTRRLGPAQPRADTPGVLAALLLLLSNPRLVESAGKHRLNCGELPRSKGGYNPETQSEGDPVRPSREGFNALACVRWFGWSLAGGRGLPAMTSQVPSHLG